MNANLQNRLFWSGRAGVTRACVSLGTGQSADCAGSHLDQKAFIKYFRFTINSHLMLNLTLKAITSYA